MKYSTHSFLLQVCSREPPCGLLLPLLRRLDVWRHPLGDVHLLRGAVVRPVRQTGTHTLLQYAACEVFGAHVSGRVCLRRLECDSALLTFSSTITFLTL